jgi:MFS family permease
MIIGMPLGRRNCIIIGNILITIGGVIQAASYSVPQIIVARVLCVCSSLGSFPCPYLYKKTNINVRVPELQYAEPIIDLY